MAVSKVVKCAEHGYGKSVRGRVVLGKPALGCAQCATAKKDEKYLIQVHVPGQKNKWKETVAGKTAAENREEEMSAEVRTLGVSADKDTTVADYLPRVLDTRPKPLAPTTRRTYDRHVQHIVNGTDTARGLGSVKVSALTTAEPIALLLNSIEITVGSATRHKCEGLIRTMLKQASKAGIVRRNPLEGEPFPAHIDGKAYVPELVELARLRAYIVGRAPRIPGDREKITAIVDTLIGTPVRISELLGLAEEDLDEINGTITVRRQVIYHPGKGYTFSPLKSARFGITEVVTPLPPFVLKSIKAAMKRNGVRATTLPWARPENATTETHALLFFRLEGKAHLPLDRSNVRDRVNLAGRRMTPPLPESLHPHSFRHAYINGLKNRVAPSVLDDITGHARRGSITERVYQSTTREDRAHVARVMQELWAAAQAAATTTGPAAVPTTPLRPAVGT